MTATQAGILKILNLSEILPFIWKTEDRLYLSDVVTSDKYCTSGGFREHDKDHDFLITYKTTTTKWQQQQQQQQQQNEDDNNNKKMTTTTDKMTN